VDVFVAAGSASAVLIIAGAIAASLRGSSRPKGLSLGDVGPALLVLVGANTITTAAKIGHLLVFDRIKIEEAHEYVSVTGDELVFLVAGVVAAVIIGLVTIQDGCTGIIARNAD
jgi:hypothetical protein